ncbi:DUF1659 domain-containing protein [Rossellomorea aquimaris]|uniref:DUF1659 domain-containing protein n=1 Tax=Rossellomorea aquimaris TaxID=189382 RepID=UPI0007D08B57|nr:DUF1659 domain-containing protein [Rossellomorea aquimaris]
MATADLKATKLRFAYNDGLDEKGNPKFQYKSYSYINGGATPDDMLSASQSLTGLSSKGLFRVEKVQNFDINA